MSGTLVVAILGPVLTAAVSTVAIIVNQRSTRRTLEHERLMAADGRLWQWRAEVYVELLERLAEWNDMTKTSAPPVPTWESMRVLHARLVAFGSPQVVELLEQWHSASDLRASLAAELSERYVSVDATPWEEKKEFLGWKVMTSRALEDLQNRVHEELQGSTS